MAHPIEEELVVLALDEPGLETSPSLRDHVADCHACAGRVAELRRLVSGLANVEPLQEPPQHVWAAIADGIRADGPDGITALTPVSEKAGSAEHRVARWPWWLTAVAAGVALVAGIGIGVVADPDESAAPTPPPEQLVATPLETLDGAEEVGSAEVVDTEGRPELHVTATFADDGDGFREVWLINVDGVRMVSLGLLPEDVDDVSFVISERLLDEGYRIVDISEEPYDGDPTHSGDSLVRGELPKLPT